MTPGSPSTAPSPVLLLGATGLFGGHLARQLGARDDITLIIAGRTKTKLEPLATELGAQPLVMDRTQAPAVKVALEQLKPFAVIDCSGPFQNYGTAPYAFAQSVLEAGAHYLDIADGADFVAGITALDTLAKQHGVCAWSGASTTPALSSAIAADLTSGLDTVDLIETSIIPGNKTPRGLSVMQAILGQVGKPFQRHRGGQTETAYGWDNSISIAPKVGAKKLKPRLASLVNTPDVALLPAHFNAATVTARAGLELPLFHHTLTIARYLIPALRITWLDRLSKPLLTLSNQFVRFGSDAGGMRVRVIGCDGNGSTQERVWDMIIPDGHGPKTPVQPVAILLDQLFAGRITPGAQPALAAFTRAQAEKQLKTIHAQFERRDRELTSIFTQALGTKALASLPQPVQALHQRGYITRFEGTAEVTAATTILGKVAALVGRFPLTQNARVPAKVEIVADNQAETWTRTMGKKEFVSVLRFDPKQPDKGITERFGPLVFGLNLNVKNGELHFPITYGRAFGVIPIPHFLTPVSTTSESVDAEGRFQFDVRISMPNGALIVHYKGYLEAH